MKLKENSLTLLFFIEIKKEGIEWDYNPTNLMHEL